MSTDNNTTDNLSSLLDAGRREARRHRSRSVRPEHLLMAMLKRPGTALETVMARLNVNPLTLRRDCEHLLLADVDLPADAKPVEPELDDDTQKIVSLAALEARNDRTGDLTAKHLLLAILHDMSGNGAKTILEENNVTYEDAAQCFTPEASDDDQESALNAALAGATAGIHAALKAFTDFIETDDEPELPAAKNTPDNKKSNAAGTVTATQRNKTAVIDAFSTDITAAAEQGVLDPVVGREREIARVQEILCRRKKNNPILIGEPGVGKSAIVEGLAQQIADGHCPAALRGKRVVALDMAGMVAGTKYRGQFEERIKKLVQELEQNPDVIVFIDEIHTIIGAGGASGTMDAANMLKPALARGVVQCIGATTTDEYRNSIEKDGGLERRFQRILVEPTTVDETLQILRNIKPRYERHHHVQYTDDALAACANLTARYVSDRAFPDKAIDALDEAGARARLHNETTPTDVAELEQKIKEAKQQKLDAVSQQNFELAADCRDRQSLYEQSLQLAKQKWENGATEDSPVITEQDIAAVVADMTGIPVARIGQAESERLRTMPDALRERVIAQERAIDSVARAIMRNRVGLHDPQRPIGAFMFLGPTGVGKTHLAKQLALHLFGTADALIRIDMSEYSEAFNTSRLVGAPPGYVGYDEGGQLTERVRRKPYSIVLLDEIEKAHASVFNLLLQVLDEGRLTDGNGRLVDFRNTIIIMTSNAGTRQLKEFANGIGFGAPTLNAANLDDSQRDRARSIIEKTLKRQFAPEFLNRLDEIVTFDQLDRTAIRRIVDIEVDRLCARVDTMGYHLTVSPATRDLVAERGYDIQYGARPLRRAIETLIEDRLTEQILKGGMTAGQSIEV